jgi:AraC family transcriptional activator of mtrCDE
MTPIAYLALWHICSAHGLLAFEGLTVAETAIRVGYESDIALSRAFKRHFDKNSGAVQRD